MVVAMVATMVVAMVASMGLLWLLPWESGVIIIRMAMVERSDNDSDSRAK